METLPRSNPLKFQCFCGSFWENNIIHLETPVFLILFGRLRNPRRTPSVSLLPVFVRSGQIHGTTLSTLGLTLHALSESGELLVGLRTLKFFDFGFPNLQIWNGFGGCFMVGFPQTYSPISKKPEARGLKDSHRKSNVFKPTPLKRPCAA